MAKFIPIKPAERKYVQLNIGFKPDLMADIRAACSKAKVTPQEFVRQAVRFALDNMP
jgi:hypothetical protein